jgi:hypothetical protein
LRKNNIVSLIRSAIYLHFSRFYVLSVMKHSTVAWAFSYLMFAFTRIGLNFLSLS